MVLHNKSDGYKGFVVEFPENRLRDQNSESEFWCLFLAPEFRI